MTQNNSKYVVVLEQDVITLLSSKTCLAFLRYNPEIGSNIGSNLGLKLRASTHGVRISILQHLPNRLSLFLHPEPDSTHPKYKD